MRSGKELHVACPIIITHSEVTLFSLDIYTEVWVLEISAMFLMLSIGPYSQHDAKLR